MSAQELIQAAVRSGLIGYKMKGPRVYVRRQVTVKRSDFPAGNEGRLAWMRAYRAELRHQAGVRPRVRRISVAREDYPDTEEGFKAYRQAYGMAWRKAKG